MTNHDDSQASMRFSIYFVLQQCRYKPPKTHDATERDVYYGRIADAVMEQIRLSGWTIEPLRLLKRPPIE